LQRIHEAAGIPLVLHGGTGIEKACVMNATKHGITKVNIATAIRQAYEKGLMDSVAAGQKAAYEATVKVVRDDLEVAGSQWLIHPGDEFERPPIS
jgi:fructose/tagatose bisphosphate aldolase